MVPNSPEWGAAGGKLSSPECLRSSLGRLKLRYNLTSLRPALFAAMYRRKFGSTVPTGFDGAPALSLANLYDGSLEKFPQPLLTQLSFGNCVARADAVAAHRLLMARPWSDAEGAALPAVSHAMGGCLPANNTVRMNRSSVRGVVAEAMYHLASGQVASPSGATPVATKVR
jgi:hypothetical protein